MIRPPDRRPPLEVRAPDDRLRYLLAHEDPQTIVRRADRSVSTFVIGDLLAQDLEPGALQAELEARSKKRYRPPDSDLHAWSDSSLYLLRRKGRIELHAEHRRFPSPGPVSIALAAEPRPHLQIDAEKLEEPPPEDPLVQRILATLTANAMTRTALRYHLGVRNERLGEVLGTLVASGKIVRLGGLLVVPVPAP